MSPVRRGHSELSVRRPSLGPMTATVETNRPPRSRPRPDARAAPDAAQAPRRPSLSPSRAADFKTCPLLYRFRTIDRLPERKSLAAVRGTLVHSVLERLYDLPPAERTVEARPELVEPAWAELREEPGVAELFAAAQDDGAETASKARVGGGVAGLGREAGRDLLRPRGPAAHRARRPRGAGRGHAARRAAAARLRRPARRRAATARCGSSTTRPARCRARRSRPRRCSR